MVCDDVQLVKLLGWEAITGHSALLWVGELNLDILLSCQMLELDRLCEVCSICDGSIVGHADGGTTEADFPASYLFVCHSALGHSKSV